MVSLGGQTVLSGVFLKSTCLQRQQVLVCSSPYHELTGTASVQQLRMPRIPLAPRGWRLNLSYPGVKSSIGSPPGGRTTIMFMPRPLSPHTACIQWVPSREKGLIEAPFWPRQAPWRTKSMLCTSPHFPGCTAYLRSLQLIFLPSSSQYTYSCSLRSSSPPYPPQASPTAHLFYLGVFSPRDLNWHRQYCHPYHGTVGEVGLRDVEGIYIPLLNAYECS